MKYNENNCLEMTEEPFGSDLMVVNCAKVSFDRRSEWEDPDNKILKPGDAHLIQYLARGIDSTEYAKLLYDICKTNTTENAEKLFYKIKNMATHWAPFSHPKMQFRVRTPMVVARQWFKHKVGFEHSEISRRYIKSQPDYYEPEYWREVNEDVKQGSSDIEVSDWSISVVDAVGHHPYSIDVEDIKNQAGSMADMAYNMMVNEVGVCPEQARMVLPQNTVTEFIATGSLYGWANLYNQRTDAHSQEEIQYLARQLDEYGKEHFPVSWSCLTATGE